MFAVQFHKFAFYKLCRVVVPGNTDCTALRADSFKDKVNDFVDTVSFKVVILQENVIADIVLDNFLIHSVCVVPFRSFPFRRSRRVPVRQGI